MLPDLPVRPRSFTLKCRQSLFVARLAHLDLLPSPPPNFAVHPVVSTVFCSDDLPINIVRTGEADEESKALSAGFLAVPSGSTEGLPTAGAAGAGGGRHELAQSIVRLGAQLPTSPSTRVVCTDFCSDNLPVNIMWMKDDDELYREVLSS